jgi:hypothetical protein
VRRTWREREASPASALPRVGGPLYYWAAALRSCASLLAELKAPLRLVSLEDSIYPHAISGPLDARQRLLLRKLETTSRPARTKTCGT